MDPSTVRLVVATGGWETAFILALRTRVAFATADDGSLDFLRSVTLALASDNTEGGREALGVPKIEDSRRNGTLDVVGVLVVAVFVATRRFNYNEPLARRP